MECIAGSSLHKSDLRDYSEMGDIDLLPGVSKLRFWAKDFCCFPHILIFPKIAFLPVEAVCSFSLLEGTETILCMRSRTVALVPCSKAK